MNALAAPPTIGQPLRRVDGRLKVTGSAKFAAEFARPKICHAVLVQSSIANGRVSKIDLSAARTAPGVIEILTRESAPRFKPYPAHSTPTLTIAVP